MSNVAAACRLRRAPLREADLEQLVALRPDLVVVSEYTDADFLNQLERSGLRVHRMVGLASLAGIRAAILDLGRAVGTPRRPRGSTARMDRDARRARGRLRGARRPRVLYWAEPA